jgi:hypothetical protein
MPERIQLRRTKGYRKPEGAVVVSRPSKWGNPFRLNTKQGLARVPAVGHPGRAWEYEGRISAAGMLHPYYHPDGRIIRCESRYLTAAEVVECYRARSMNWLAVTSPAGARSRSRATRTFCWNLPTAVPMSERVAHDHPAYVPGCFRCDLSRDDYLAHPSGVECIQITEHMSFCVGNAIKYLWRADEKGNALEDLRKAAWYVQREIARRTAATEGNQ